MLYYLDDPSLPLKVLKQQLETVSLESFFGRLPGQGSLSEVQAHVKCYNYSWRL